MALRQYTASWETEFSFKPDLERARTDWKEGSATMMPQPQSGSPLRGSFAATRHSKETRKPSRSSSAHEPNPKRRTCPAGSLPLAPADTAAPRRRPDGTHVVGTAHIRDLGGAEDGVFDDGRLESPIRHHRGNQDPADNRVLMMQRGGGSRPPSSASFRPGSSAGPVHAPNGPYPGHHQGPSAEGIRAWSGDGRYSNSNPRPFSRGREWDRQRAVRDAVGEEAQWEPVDQGHDMRYRQPGEKLGRLGRTRSAQRERDAAGGAPLPSRRTASSNKHNRPPPTQDVTKRRTQPQNPHVGFEDGYEEDERNMQDYRHQDVVPLGMGGPTYPAVGQQDPPPRTSLSSYRKGMPPPQQGGDDRATYDAQPQQQQQGLLSRDSVAEVFFQDDRAGKPLSAYATGQSQPSQPPSSYQPQPQLPPPPPPQRYQTSSTPQGFGGGVYNNTAYNSNAAPPTGHPSYSSLPSAPPTAALHQQQPPQQQPQGPLSYQPMESAAQSYLYPPPPSSSQNPPAQSFPQQQQQQQPSYYQPNNHSVPPQPVYNNNNNNYNYSYPSQPPLSQMGQPPQQQQQPVPLPSQPYHQNNGNSSSSYPPPPPQAPYSSTYPPPPPQQQPQQQPYYNDHHNLPPPTGAPRFPPQLPSDPSASPWFYQPSQQQQQQQQAPPLHTTSMFEPHPYRGAPQDTSSSIPTAADHHNFCGNCGSPVKAAAAGPSSSQPYDAYYPSSHSHLGGTVPPPPFAADDASQFALPAGPKVKEWYPGTAGPIVVTKPLQTPIPSSTDHYSTAGETQRPLSYRLPGGAGGPPQRLPLNNDSSVGQNVTIVEHHHHYGGGDQNSSVYTAPPLRRPQEVRETLFSTLGGGSQEGGATSVNWRTRETTTTTAGALTSPPRTTTTTTAAAAISRAGVGLPQDRDVYLSMLPSSGADRYHSSHNNNNYHNMSSRGDGGRYGGLTSPGREERDGGALRGRPLETPSIMNPALLGSMRSSTAPMTGAGWGDSVLMPSTRHLQTPPRP